MTNGRERPGRLSWLPVLSDENGVLRRRLDAQKASFAPMADAVESSGTAYGGITPIGLSASWPVLIDAAGADIRRRPTWSNHD